MASIQMALDNRELILSALADVLREVEGVEDFRRNDLGIPEDRRPAVILLDGDEIASDKAFGRGRPTTGINLVMMTPEVYLLLAGKPSSVGTDLNTLRNRIISAVVTDATLLGLVYNNDIRYEGSENGLAAGRSIEGEMRLNFSFTYLIKP